MKLTLLKEASKVVHFTDFFLGACSVYSHFEFKLKNNDTTFQVSKIQTMTKLYNLTTTSFVGFVQLDSTCSNDGIVIKIRKLLPFQFSLRKLFYFCDYNDSAQI